MSSTVILANRSHDIQVVESSGAYLSERVQSAGIAYDARPLSNETRHSRRDKMREKRDFIVKRRLKGFIADAHGETWRVIFVEKGEKIPYDLPANYLRKAGVEQRYQPFEMDELEPTDPTLSGKVYRFRPLAPTNSAILESLPLDPERERKRNLILKKFKNPQG